MKTFFLTLIIALSACGWICAADELPLLKIEGVKGTYSLDEPVTMEVTNLSSRTITYGIGVLIQMNGKWEEFITNIEDHEIVRKAFMMRELRGNSSKHFAWSLKDLDKKYAVKKGVFRFYLAFKGDDGLGTEVSGNIGSAVGKSNRHLIFSDIFEIRP